jgi:hypothetical protein
VQDASGADTTAIEQGHKMHFTGRVLDGLGGALVPLEGVADVLVEDAAPTLQAPPCVLSTCDRPFYRYRAGTIYRGQVSIHGGTFAGDFIVPIEARPGRPSRIRAYVSNSSTDGTGDLPLRVATGTSAIDDQAGPEIRLSFANGATRVRPDAALRIDLTDPSGILLTGHTKQNGIIVTIDGNSTNRVDVTGDFSYAEGSYTTGTASFTLPGLARGLTSSASRPPTTWPPASAPASTALRPPSSSRSPRRRRSSCSTPTCSPIRPRPRGRIEEGGSLPIWTGARPTCCSGSTPRPASSSAS